jgi:uncharacterized membrane protein YdfJ with MMPL/SSD domain
VFIAIAIGAIAVVIASVLAAMTLLPAALSLLGDNVNAWLFHGSGNPRNGLTIRTKVDSGTGSLTL